MAGQTGENSEDDLGHDVQKNKERALTSNSKPLSQTVPPGRQRASGVQPTFDFGELFKEGLLGIELRCVDHESQGLTGRTHISSQLRQRRRNDKAAGLSSKAAKHDLDGGGRCTEVATLK